MSSAYSLFNKREGLFYRGSAKHTWHEQGILFTDPVQLLSLAAMHHGGRGKTWAEDDFEVHEYSVNSPGETQVYTISKFRAKLAEMPLTLGDDQCPNSSITASISPSPLLPSM